MAFKKEAIIKRQSTLFYIQEEKMKDKGRV